MIRQCEQEDYPAALPAAGDGPGRASSMTPEAWHQIGRDLARQRQQLDRLGSRQMWAIGDWLVAGEQHVYRHLKRTRVKALAAQVTGYSRHSLTMAASVARRVPPAVRVDGLSWWHHLAVSGLDEEQQVDWLTRAAEGDWSARRLREELAAAGRIRPRSGARAKRLIGEFLKLRLGDLPESTRAQLREWWDRENG